MKVKQLLGMGLVLQAGMTWAATLPQPLLHYGFNDSGTSLVSTGTDTLALALSNAAQVTGLSGKPGDLAYNYAANSSSRATGAVGLDANLTTGLPSSFTFTAWVNNVTPNDIVQRVFVLSGGSGNAIEVSLYGGSGDNRSVLRLAVNGTLKFVNSVTVPKGLGWSFIAVAYNSTAKTVDFYVGDANTGSTLNTASTTFDNTILPYTNSTALTVGNHPTSDRPLNGMMDEVSFYGSTLTGTQVNDLRISQLAVPEASSVGLLSGAVLVAQGARKIYRRDYSK